MLELAGKGLKLLPLQKLTAVANRVTVGNEITVLIDTVTGSEGDSVQITHSYIGRAVVLTSEQRKEALLEAFGAAGKEP